MSKVNPEVVTHVKSLFLNGLEGYDKEQRKNINIGGAKLWAVKGWKDPESSQIKFNQSEPLYEALLQLRAILYVANRVQLDDNGNPVNVEGSKSHQRIDHSLMLYFQNDYSSAGANRAVQRILNAQPELDGYVYNLADLEDELNQIGMVEYIDDVPCLKGMTHYSPRVEGKQAPIKLHSCVFLSIDSGSQGSSQFWSYASRQTTAQYANDRFVAQVEEVTEMDTPF